MITIDVYSTNPDPNHTSSMDEVANIIGKNKSLISPGKFERFFQHIMPNSTMTAIRDQLDNVPASKEEEEERKRELCAEIKRDLDKLPERADLQELIERHSKLGCGGTLRRITSFKRPHIP